MMTEITEFVKPEVRDEPVEIVGPKPDDFKGLGHLNGDILVRYPDGELGCVTEDQISEGTLVSES